MLVLSRKAGEKIVIADDICVTVLTIRGNKVLLGIAAPEKVHILRQELVPHLPAQSGKPTATPHERRR